MLVNDVAHGPLVFFLFFTDPFLDPIGEYLLAIIESKLQFKEIFTITSYFS